MLKSPSFRLRGLANLLALHLRNDHNAGVRHFKSPWFPFLGPAEQVPTVLLLLCTAFLGQT
jgi:hypothetical protein